MPETRKYTFIKYDGKTVKLKWTSRAYEDKNGGWLSSPDKPKAAFIDALQALKPEVLKELKLPKSYGDDLEVRSVSSTYEEKGDDELRGIVITLAKKLPDFNSPFMINTPYQREAGENTDADTPAIPSNILAILEELEDAAGDFIALQREVQRDAFEDQDDDDESSDKVEEDELETAGV